MAETLNRLGLNSPRADDLIPAGPWNRQGHWESKQLSGFNERLLRRLGGAWTSPPELHAGWQSDKALDDLRIEAASTLAAIFGPRPIAWKDPRLCVVLPFWETVISPPAAAVLVYREPLEVAASLTSRNGLPTTHGLALWERYLRSACTNLAGIPTVVTDYQRVLERPAEWFAELVDFLRDVGVVVDHGSAASALASINADLHHQRIDSGQRSGSVMCSEETMDILRDLQGPHHPWRAPALGPEPAWVADVLAVRRMYDKLKRTYEAATTSRAYRLASWIRRRAPADL